MNKKLTIENTRGLVDPCIYMLIAPNGKIYVGSTINGFHSRSKTYRNEKAHCLIGRALKKYNARDFTFSILESSSEWQKGKLQKREQHYMDTLHPFGTRGYNIERVAGMVTAPTRYVSQFTRAGEPLASFESAKWASVVTGVHGSDITSCCKGKLPGAGGYLWLYSEDATQQEIERRVERAASKKKKRSVSQYTRAGVLVKEYESGNQAARETGVNGPSITTCCKGKKPSAGGYLWLYSENATQQEIERRVERAESLVSSDKRSVSQYTLAGVLVKEYESGRQAARETGVHGTSITACCKGKRLSTGGFIWKYTKEKPHAT